MALGRRHEYDGPVQNRTDSAWRVTSAVAEPYVGWLKVLSGEGSAEWLAEGDSVVPDARHCRRRAR